MPSGLLNPQLEQGRTLQVYLDRHCDRSGALRKPGAALPEAELAAVDMSKDMPMVGVSLEGGVFIPIFEPLIRRGHGTDVLFLAAAN
jgi:hypothetical protein